MLRHLAFGCFVVAFAAFAFWGCSQWADTSDVGRRDEAPLQLGTFPKGGPVEHNYIMMGNPWSARGEEVSKLKRELPPDPWGEFAADEIEKANRRAVHQMKVTMPTGVMRWPEIFAKLRDAFAAFDIQVVTGKPEPSPALMLGITKPTWTGFEILTELANQSQKLIMYDVTTEGVVVGTDEGCRLERLRATLKEARRRVAAVNTEVRLDAPFRPDLRDATIVGFAKAVTTQTGIEVVVDGKIWDTIHAIKWRGEPRRLREALDELCTRLRVYWRYHQGAVWLLSP